MLEISEHVLLSLCLPPSLSLLSLSLPFLRHNDVEGSQNTMSHIGCIFFASSHRLLVDKVVGLDDPTAKLVYLARRRGRHRGGCGRKEGASPWFGLPVGGVFAALLAALCGRPSSSAHARLSCRRAPPRARRAAGEGEGEGKAPGPV